jgi:hypothetical protein
MREQAGYRSSTRMTGFHVARIIVSGLLTCTYCLTDGTVGRTAADSTAREKQWTFDEAAPGTLPEMFSIGTLFDGRPAGEWRILITNRAKSSSQVLAQVGSKGADHAYKLVLLDGTNSSNLDVEVSFLPVSGKADLGGGLIWRAKDDRNYYLLRASAVEQNIRLYRVVKGTRQLIKNHNRSIGPSGWHTLRVIQHGCEMQIRYDNEPLFQLCEQTFDQGRVGLWTKSDAVTYFDDLRLRLLDEPTSP